MGIKCNRDEVVCKCKHPLDDNEWLYYMADVPHLLKNIRAGLCNGNEIILPDDIVKKENLPGNKVTIEHVKELVDFQKDKTFRLVPFNIAVTESEVVLCAKSST